MNTDGSPVLNSRTETYGYDEINRLTSVNYGDGGTQQYSFDNMGNRLSLQDSSAGTTNYTYNASNMLLTAGGNSYVNDADGNTLSGGGRTNTWDAQNRLIGCAYNGHTTSTVYGYDGLRRQSTIDGVTTEYLLDGQNAVQEGHAVNGTFISTATYFNGMYRRDDVAQTIRWYIMDGLGSVVGEVDPSGNLTCRRGFDVYGATRSQTGTPTSKHGFVGRLGHETEDACGMTYMRARWYDASVGRFVSEDPAQHGNNWIAYVSDNPTNLVDADGKMGESPDPRVELILTICGYVGGICMVLGGFNHILAKNPLLDDFLLGVAGFAAFVAAAFAAPAMVFPLVVLGFLAVALACLGAVEDTHAMTGGVQKGGRQ